MGLRHDYSKRDSPRRSFTRNDDSIFQTPIAAIYEADHAGLMHETLVAQFLEQNRTSALNVCANRLQIFSFQSPMESTSTIANESMSTSQRQRRPSKIGVVFMLVLHAKASRLQFLGPIERKPFLHLSAVTGSSFTCMQRHRNRTFQGLKITGSISSLRELSRCLRAADHLHLYTAHCVSVAALLAAKHQRSRVFVKMLARHAYPINLLQMRPFGELAEE